MYVRDIINGKHKHYHFVSYAATLESYSIIVEPNIYCDQKW